MLFRQMVSILLSLMVLGCVTQAPDGMTTSVWRAIGTEPFWGVRVDGRHLIFTTPEAPAGRVLPAALQQVEGKTVFAGADGDVAYRLELTLGECSDNMSERKYRYKAVFVLGKTEYHGCAAAPGDRWGEQH